MKLLNDATEASSGSRQWRTSTSVSGFVIAFMSVDCIAAYKAYSVGILAAVGFGAVYGNILEFKGDGTMTIYPKGGGNFAGYVYSAFTVKLSSNKVLQ